MGKLWFQNTAEEIALSLGSDIHAGLSSAAAKTRLEQDGMNELREKPRETMLQKFLNQFKDFLVLILIAASVISALTGEIADSLVIIAIVLLNAGLGLFQEFKAEQALSALKKLAAPHAKVIRDGHLVTIPTGGLVTGDIVKVEAGDYIPADVRFIEAINLKVEEASLTGESVPVEKHTQVIHEEVPLADQQNLGFMSTIVTYGRGTAIVVETGMKTEIGKIAAMLQAYEDEATPLQKKLEEFGKLLGLLCLVVCAMVFALGIYVGYSDGVLEFDEVRLMLMTSISLAVAAIPEGLPTVVTIVLALGMQRMVKRNSIVKRLHAVETLGSITVICSDKTGTLTQNQMTAVKLCAGTKLYDVSGEGYSPEGTFAINGIPVLPQEDLVLSRLLLGGLLCSDAAISQNPENGAWTVSGDPTEGALVVAAAKGGFAKEALAEMNARIQEIPFDSDRKMMTTFHSTPEGKTIAYIKGAPDVILGRSANSYDDGAIRLLTDETRQFYHNANKEMASQALRVLAVACREFDNLPEDLSSANIEQNLTYLGLVGMIDPPRAEAREAVKVAISAGIRPVMITGDHPDTAYAIAKELGIVQDSGQVITGKELDGISGQELREVVNRVSVYARVSPAHKVAIVEALKANNHIVAMTGDGVNDAPALKKADIGVAMGITGTDVTKETAEMVVTDDNFASIVAAVEEGRVIYANIRKFVYFLLSCNLSEIMVIFFAMLLGWPIPLLPIQLLWINLVTDAFPALALGMEKKEPNIMNLPPRSPSEPLLSKKMQLIIGVQSIAMAAVVLWAFRYGLDTHSGNLDIARTYAFITLIASQLACTYAARSGVYSVFNLGLFSNRYVNIGVGISAFLLILSVYGPLSSIFRTVMPVPGEWLLLMALSPIPFAVVEIAKALLNKRGRQSAKTISL